MKNKARKHLNKTIEQMPFIWNLLQSVTQSGLRIVYYHMVSEKQHPYYYGPGLTPQSFQQQIKRLKKKFHIISMDEAIESIRSGSDLKNCLTLTLDDGFKECYTYIAPILSDENVTATFYLTEDSIDNQNLIWRSKVIYLDNILLRSKKIELINQWKKNSTQKIHSLTELSNQWKMAEKETLAKKLWEQTQQAPIQEWLDENKPYLSSKEIERLISQGFTLGSHTKTHPKCNQLNFDELNEEIIESTNRLSHRFNVPIQYFSYPFGLRAKQQDEKLILEKSSLISLQGIEDRLTNNTNHSYWERQSLESQTPWADFFLMPIQKRLIHTKRYKYLPDH